jgi:hypothetical protein
MIYAELPPQLIEAARMQAPKVDCKTFAVSEYQRLKREGYEPIVRISKDVKHCYVEFKKDGVVYISSSGVVFPTDRSEF